MPADADTHLKAVVLVSGGLDSATVLALARSDNARCYALTFDYGQRHQVELDAARKVSQKIGVVDHRVVTLNIGWMGGSALTDDQVAVPRSKTSGIPVTYVPARNTIFLSVALGWAEVLGASAIYIGANAVDYSGYPDCRPQFIQAFEHLAKLGTKVGVEGSGIRIRAPLMSMRKSEIIQTGARLGVDFSDTLSCYDPGVDGLACGQCDACRLRAQGFLEAGVPDPTHYR